MTPLDHAGAGEALALGAGEAFALSAGEALAAAAADAATDAAVAAAAAARRNSVLHVSRHGPNQREYMDSVWAQEKPLPWEQERPKSSLVSVAADPDARLEDKVAKAWATTSAGCASRPPNASRMARRTPGTTRA